MVQSPSWETNWFAASQEIPRISRNPKVLYRTHKRPPPVSILGQPNPVHIPTSHHWRSILILSTHLRLGLPSGLFPSGFPTKTLYTPSPHPHAPHAQPISFFSILSPAQYWVSSTNHLAPRYAILRRNKAIKLVGLTKDQFWTSAQINCLPFWASLMTFVVQILIYNRGIIFTVLRVNKLENINSKLNLHFYTSAQECESSTHISYSLSHKLCYLLDISCPMDVVQACCLEVRWAMFAWR